MPDLSIASAPSRSLNSRELARTAPTHAGPVSRPDQFFNLHFERALLGNFLLCADIGVEPSPGFELVDPQDYYLEVHRILARAIQKIVSRGLPPTGPLLLDVLCESYPESRAGELVAYFSSLSEGVARISPSWFYARWIIRLAALRKIARVRAAIGMTGDAEQLRQLNIELNAAISNLPPEPSSQRSTKEK